MTHFLDDNFEKQVEKMVESKLALEGKSKAERKRKSDLAYFKALESRNNEQALNNLGQNFDSLSFIGEDGEDENSKLAL